jgi:hypothetical protein
LSGVWYLPTGQRSSESGILAYALELLPAERGTTLLESYNASTGYWRMIFLLVMASEASR